MTLRILSYAALILFVAWIVAFLSGSPTAIRSIGILLLLVVILWFIAFTSYIKEPSRSE